jgi:hypothetical protein
VSSRPDRFAAIERVRGAVRAEPGLARVLEDILDRRERRGGLPSTLTVAADRVVAEALRALMSARAVRDSSAGRVRIDLAHADEVCRTQLGLGAAELFYAVLGRTPRDLAAEETALRAAVCRGLDAARAAVATACARAFLDGERGEAERGVGDTYRSAAQSGVEGAVAEAAAIAACVDAALANEAPVRLPNFAARVLGDSKALALGTDRARRLGRALLDADPRTRDEVACAGVDPGGHGAYREALEANGIFRDESALTVCCFGPLVYRKARDRFEHVAAHARHGDVVPLSLAQLRGASAVELPARRALVIENLTPFLDYVEALRAAGVTDELVVLSSGQASWAVVQLLRLVARAGVPIAHAGDLDRSGVLILRSLSRRAGAAIEPVAMDVATHRRFRARGRELSADERARLAALVAADDAASPCHQLLVEILESGVWLEQETFASEALLSPIAHGNHP